MVFTLGSGSAWDFWNTKNWAINKSLSQNLRELSVGSQIMGTVIPEALAYKMAQQVTAGMAARAAVTQTAPAAAAAGSGTAAAGGGAAAGSALLPALAVAPLAIKAGTGIYVLDWLQKNWWIPALFLGGIIALKYAGKKR